MGVITHRWISASKILSILFSLFLTRRGGTWAEMLYLGAFIFLHFLSYTRNFSTLSWKLTVWHVCSLTLEWPLVNSGNRGYHKETEKIIRQVIF